MTNSIHANPTTPHGEPGDRDLLISRVVDGRASAAEWSALETLAAHDPGVWRELATAQRDQRAIEMIVASAGDVAQSVDLPAAPDEEVQFQAPSTRLRLWGGWVAAAVMACAFVAQFRSENQGGPRRDPQASLVPTADELLDQYRNTGRKEGIVLGEVPDQVLLAMEPAADGRGATVTFVRQFVERRYVPDVVQFRSHGETGALVGNPQRLPVRGSEAH